jgi:hypothetical protein
MRPPSSIRKNWNKIPVLLFLLLVLCKPLMAQQTYDPFLWAKSPTSATGYNFGTSISSYYNNAGYVYAAGIFTGTITFGSTTLTSAGDEDVYLVCYDNCNQAVLWAVSIGGSLKDNTDLNKVAISAEGGTVYITGSVNRNAAVTFNGNGSTSVTLSSLPGNGNDIFVAEYQYNTGNLRWAKTFGSAGSAQETGTCIYSTITSGGFVVGGRFNGTVNFGPNAYSNPINITSNGGSDGFVMKALSMGGSFMATLWVSQIGGMQDDLVTDVVSRIYGTPSGSVNTYVSGTYGNGGGTATVYQPYNNTSSQTIYTSSAWNNNGNGAFVGCIDYTNNWQWFNSIPVTGTGTGITGVNAHIDFDYFNYKIYVAGNFDDDITVYDATGYPYNISANVGNNDIYTTAFNLSGNYLWSSPQVHQLTSTTTSDEQVCGIRHEFISGSTTYKIAGTFTNTTTFTAGSSLSVTSAGGTDIYVCMIDKSTGNVQDLWRAGSTGNETVYGIDNSVSNSNITYLTGQFNNSTVIGNTTLTGSGNQSYFTALTSDRLEIQNAGSSWLPGVPGSPPYLRVNFSSNFMNYQWFLNGVPIPVTSATYYPTVKGLYYVEANDNYCTGYRYRSNEIFIGEDCSPALGTTYPTNYTFTSNTTVSNEILDGIITIAPGVTVDFSGTIMMTPCSKIIVNPSGALNISSCQVYSCQQWKGIIVENGGNLNVNSSSVIRDAVVAIYSESPISVDQTSFSFNKVSIALNNTSGSSRITSCQFSDMYIANPYCTIGSGEPIYPYINSNHYIDMQNCIGGDQIYRNDFNGIAPTGVSFDPSGIIAVNLQICDKTDLETNNFHNIMEYGIDMIGSKDISVYYNNSFTGVEILKGIGIDACFNVNISYNNTFDQNSLYGIKAENSAKLIVTGNNMFNNCNGIYCNKVITYFINMNTFNTCPYGAQAYNDDYQPPQQVIPPLCVMSQNDFNSCEHGIVIAPKLDPFTNNTGLPNTLIPGQTLEYVLLTCNNFNTNTWAIGYTGTLIDHFGGDDPMNMFNGSVNWDIISRSKPFTKYYYMGPKPNTTTSGASVSMDGISTSASSVNLIATGSFYSNCSYIPPLKPALSVPIEALTNCQVYPNPANEALNIKGAKTGSIFIVTDIAGRQLVKGVITGEITSLDISQLNEGMYLVRLQDQDNNLQIVKFARVK